MSNDCIRSAAALCLLVLSNAACKPRAFNEKAKPKMIGSPLEGISEKHRKSVAALRSPVGTKIENCTGTVICTGKDETWVLTAAHCKVNMGTEVSFGARRSAPDFKCATKKAIPHPNYAPGPNKVEYDIALVEIDCSSNAGSLNCVPMADELPEKAGFNSKGEIVGDGIGSKLRVVGFGRNAQGNNDPGLEGDAYFAMLQDTTNTIAAYTPEAKTNFGDSGGPLLYKDTILGALNRPDTQGNFSFYANVVNGPFRQWVNDTIGIQSSPKPAKDGGGQNTKTQAGASASTAPAPADSVSEETVTDACLRKAVELARLDIAKQKGLEGKDLYVSFLNARSGMRVEGDKLPSTTFAVTSKSSNSVFSYEVFVRPGVCKPEKLLARE